MVQSTHIEGDAEAGTRRTGQLVLEVLTRTVAATHTPQYWGRVV